MRTSGGSVDVRNSGGSADWRNSDGSGSSGGSAPGQRISSSTIDNLFRNSSELADLPQLTVDEELQTDGEDAADATVMRLSGGIGTQLKLEQRKEQETSPAHISAKSAASNPICAAARSVWYPSWSSQALDGYSQETASKNKSSSAESPGAEPSIKFTSLVSNPQSLKISISTFARKELSSGINACSSRLHDQRISSEQR